MSWHEPQSSTYDYSNFLFPFVPQYQIKKTNIKNSSGEYLTMPTLSFQSNKLYGEVIWEYLNKYIYISTKKMPVNKNWLRMKSGDS